MLPWCWFITAAAVGWWTLCIGAAYYVFQAAGHLLAPPARNAPGERWSGRFGAFQPFAPRDLRPGSPGAAGAAGAPALALALLVFSFTRDVVEERGSGAGSPAAKVRRPLIR